MPRNLNHPDPLRRLRAIRALEAKLERDKLAAIQEARGRGISWGRIDLALGIPRSAAWRWYRRRIALPDGNA